MAQSTTTTTAFKHAFLSPLDQIMPPAYTHIFHVFQTVDQDAAIAALQKGLNKVVSILPYLAGTIACVPGHDATKRGDYRVTWPTIPVTTPLREIPAPRSFPSLAQLRVTHAPQHLFTLSLTADFRVPVPPDGGSQALLASYTPIEGGLLVCIAVQHTLMDGMGQAAFVQLWAACTCGVDMEDVPDTDELFVRTERLQRGCGLELLQDARGKTVEDLAARHPEYAVQGITPARTSLDLQGKTPPKCTTQLFAFSAARIGVAKTWLAARLEPGMCTVNNILGAILWLSITRVRLARLRREGVEIPGGTETSRIGFAVDGRRKLRPAFGEGSYLGNINMLKVANARLSDMEAGSAAKFTPNDTELDLTSLTQLVSAIAAATSRVDATHIAEVCELMAKIPDQSAVGPGWNSSHGLDLGYTSWANMGLYECDFGEGLGGGPEFVRTRCYDGADGALLVLPRRRRRVRGDGGDGDRDERIEVVVMLNEEDVRGLEGDGVVGSWLC